MEEQKDINRLKVQNYNCMCEKKIEGPKKEKL